MASEVGDLRERFERIATTGSAVQEISDRLDILERQTASPAERPANRSLFGHELSAIRAELGNEDESSVEEVDQMLHRLQVACLNASAGVAIAAHKELAALNPAGQPALPDGLLGADGCLQHAALDDQSSGAGLSALPDRHLRELEE